jgi:surface protein
MKTGLFCKSHRNQAGDEVFPEERVSMFKNIRIEVAPDSETVNWYKDGRVLHQAPTQDDNDRYLKMPATVFASDRATTVGEITGLGHITSLLAPLLDDCEVVRGGTVEATTFTALLEQYDPEDKNNMIHEMSENNTLYITKLRIDHPLEINERNKEKYSDVFAYVEAIESKDNVVSCIGNMSSLFRKSCIRTIQGQWDTSQVTSMGHMFLGAKNFNGDISRWNTGRVENMWAMFHGAESFNGDISAWTTGNVADMEDMFSGARSFQPVALAWNTKKVQSMASMFRDATLFNGDISRWETGRVRDMSYMFSDAKNFNGDISTWKTQDVIVMNDMFAGATSFDQDISHWVISEETDVSEIFFGAENLQDLHRPPGLR